MGIWYIDENDRWQYDPDGKAQDAEPRTWTPVATSEHPDLIEKPDGSVYGRVEPTVFNLFDDVDSRSITDDGGPPDAA